MFFDTPSVPTLLGSVILLLVLDIVVVLLRFYTRRRLRQALKLDDWLMIPSLIGVIAMSSIYFYGIHSKAFGYRWRLPQLPGVAVGPDYVSKTADSSGQRIFITRKLQYSMMMLVPNVLGTLKISVLSFYRRIFVITRHWKDPRNFFISFLIVLCSVWVVIFDLAMALTCREIVETFSSKPLMLSVRCANTTAMGYYSDFIFDAIIIFIPIPFIWQLHLPTTRKIGVTSVFLLGILACGVPLVRMVWMLWSRHTGFTYKADEERKTTEVYWIMLEITLGVLATCLPTLRGLVKIKPADDIVQGVWAVLSWFGLRGKYWKQPPFLMSEAEPKLVTGRVEERHGKT